MPEKAIFLDRDGVINKNRDDYVKSIEELEILDGVFKTIKKFNKLNFKVIVISNQSAINRNKTTKEKVEKIHELILYLCKKNNCNIDGFYYCPHRPDENCFCRKPNPGLLLKAANDHKINLKVSWMIGDKKSDIEAGKKVGCQTIMIKTNENLNNSLQKFLDKLSKNEMSTT